MKAGYRTCFHMLYDEKKKNIYIYIPGQQIMHGYDNFLLYSLKTASKLFECALNQQSFEQFQHTLCSKKISLVLKKLNQKLVRYFLSVIFNKTDTKEALLLKYTVYIYIYIYNLTALVEGDLEALFSIATTPRYRWGCYSIPWIASLYPWSLPYNTEC